MRADGRELDEYSQLLDKDRAQLAELKELYDGNMKEIQEERAKHKEFVVEYVELTNKCAQATRDAGTGARASSGSGKAGRQTSCDGSGTSVRKGAGGGKAGPGGRAWSHCQEAEEASELGKAKA